MRAADRFQMWNRQRKVDWITDFIDRHQIRSCLLVGVGARTRELQAWEVMIEAAITARCEFTVWSGLDTANPLWSPYLAADALRLPFPDGAFDLVYSNAVIEHVGDEAAQRTFIAEHARVGRRWAATTPNRWFPVEPHTRTLFAHWSPTWRQSRSEFTRLLSRREFRRLAGNVDGSLIAPTFTAWGHTPISGSSHAIRR